jgi:hypothetical protein
MNSLETPAISQVAELLAQNGYDVQDAASGVLLVRDLETNVAFQAALQGNILFMTLNLTSAPTASITAAMMRQMLDAHNGISTSAFQLYDLQSGQTAITLNNFCTLQDMGPEDRDDILSSASYLMVDLVAARDLLQPVQAS